MCIRDRTHRNAVANTMLERSALLRAVKCELCGGGVQGDTVDDCQGRVRLIEPASIEISDLRTYDEGWYECSVVMLNEQTGEQASENGSWVHLTVNGWHYQ